MTNVKASTILRKALTYLYPDLPGMPIGDLMFGVRAAIVAAGQDFRLWEYDNADLICPRNMGHPLFDAVLETSRSLPQGFERQALRFDLIANEAEYRESIGE